MATDDHSSLFLPCFAYAGCSRCGVVVSLNTVLRWEPPHQGGTLRNRLAFHKQYAGAGARNLQGGDFAVMLSYVLSLVAVTFIGSVGLT